MTGHREEAVPQAPPQDRSHELAAEVIGLLVTRGGTVAVAESLTGGLLAGALTSIPGASAAFRGGVVAYATDLKSSLLGVPPELLERHGAVHRAVAEAMAAGARRRMAASVGAATTGVAGPDPADGQPVGTVHIAVASAVTTRARALRLTGDRQQIRRATVEQALDLLVAVLREDEIRLHRYIGEHAAVPSPAWSVRAGTVEASAERPRKGGDDGPASSLAR
jgi:nicotinamide-nucleotide amidase